MIREIAEPILEQLKKIEKQLGNHRMPQLPQIKFVKEGNMADAPDLGSGAFGVGVRVPSPAPLVNLDNYFGSCLFLFYVIIFIWKFVYIMKK